MIALTIAALIVLSIIVGYRWGHKEGVRSTLADVRKLLIDFVVLASEVETVTGDSYV